MRVIVCADTGETCSTYAEYLRSRHWRLTTARLWASGMPRRCMRCGSKEAVNVHHKTYRRIGAEHLTDLLPLCEPCHHKLHAGEWDRRSFVGPQEGRARRRRCRGNSNPNR